MISLLAARRAHRANHIHSFLQSSCGATWSLERRRQQLASIPDLKQWIRQFIEATPNNFCIAQFLCQVECNMQRTRCKSPLYSDSPDLRSTEITTRISFGTAFRTVFNNYLIKVFIFVEETLCLLFCNRRTTETNFRRPAGGWYSISFSIFDLRPIRLTTTGSERAVVVSRGVPYASSCGRLIQSSCPGYEVFLRRPFQWFVRFWK